MEQSNILLAPLELIVTYVARSTENSSHVRRIGTFRVYGLGFWVLGFGFWVFDIDFWVSGLWSI
jgi:hypothetical protein